jgi:hypothetical protein
MRFPPYVKRLVEGGAKINPQIKKIKEKSSMILPHKTPDSCLEM